MKISEYDFRDRPRERILAGETGHLADAELLAVLLRTGLKGKNVIDVARELLSAAGYSLCALERMTPGQMARIQGIGRDKAATVSAALELGRRLRDEAAADRNVVDSPSDACRLLKPLFREDALEECWCLFLKRSRKVLCSRRISEGGETMTEINIKKIVRTAIDNGAAAVILAHNHPSGNPEPSGADIRLTEKLRRALATFEISLTDHVILSGDFCYSFSEEAVFPTRSRKE